MGLGQLHDLEHLGTPVPHDTDGSHARPPLVAPACSPARRSRTIASAGARLPRCDDGGMARLALVTGGAGYIGSHVCVALVEAGWRVVVLDDLSNGSPVAVGRVEALTGAEVPLLVGDVTDPDVVAGVLDSGDVTAVVHLAGLKAVGESVADPLRYYRANLDGLLTLVEAMPREGRPPPGVLLLGDGLRRVRRRRAARGLTTGRREPVRQDQAVPGDGARRPGRIGPVVADRAAPLLQPRRGPPVGLCSARTPAASRTT